jgi:hypothetical protein
MIAGLIWAGIKGYLGIVFGSETTGIGYGLVAVFVIAMIGFAQRAYKTSKALNDLKKNPPWKPNDVAAQKMLARKIMVKCSFISSVAVWLVTLGLIGNIVGFALAVNGLDLSGGPDTALTAIGQMIDGMKVAFFTTLIGTALGLWLAVNAHILHVANSLLMLDSEPSP